MWHEMGKRTKIWWRTQIIFGGPSSRIGLTRSRNDLRLMKLGQRLNVEAMQVVHPR